MIKTTQLTNQLLSISSKIKGVKLFDYDFTSIDLKEIIKTDIMSYFDNIKRINIDIRMEEIKDARILYPACLLEIEMLLSFDLNIEEGDVEIITKYLQHNFLNGLAKYNCWKLLNIYFSNFKWIMNCFINLYLIKIFSMSKQKNSGNAKSKTNKQSNSGSYVGLKYIKRTGPEGTKGVKTGGRPKK